MEHPYLSKIRILIVDDQSFSRQLLRRILGVLGCRRVTEAKSVELAWNALLLSPPDMLIVDWEMEETDGLELVRRIRHEKDSPDMYMPIIMLTAHSELPRIETARDAGVNEFIIKPLSAETLFKRLDAVIEHPRRFVRIKDYFGPDRRRHTGSFPGEDRRTKTPKPAPTIVEEAPAS
ncbi:MAG: response regulator [Rhodospirillales bacterium]|nr:response regulator [Rhodospirillales bacterium]